MKLRDVIISGNAAWEIIRIEDRGRQAAVKLIAGEGSEARINEVPKELLVGAPIYRRVDELADIDVYRAAEEVSRYVDVAGCGWSPRKWVSEFRRKYPAKSTIPDETTMFGWFACLLQAGEEKIRTELKQKRLEKTRKTREQRRRAAAKEAGVPIKTRASAHKQKSK